MICDACLGHSKGGACADCYDQAIDKIETYESILTGFCIGYVNEDQTLIEWIAFVDDFRLRALELLGDKLESFQIP